MQTESAPREGVYCHGYRLYYAFIAQQWDQSAINWLAAGSFSDSETGKVGEIDEAFGTR